MWHQPWRPARLRTVLAAGQLRAAATHALDLHPRDVAGELDIAAARRWLAARGVAGVMRFPIERFGSDSAPERRAMRGNPLAVRPEP
jgi:CRISPR-associated protein Csb3